jgi:UDP-4-amino-4,6-dideoxy-N-acetyl-beta-L-altrosamine transaminase
VIPYGRQCIDDDDIAAVTAVLHGDWLTQGPAVEEFERALTAVTGAAHAVAFANGTAALHAAAAAAELGPGDRVATSPLSFAASANCARYVGATPVFADIDPATLNLDVRQVADVDALVAVHYAGLPVNLAALASRPRVVIEDAAHAIGAMTPDGPVGNCARSDMCCFSFHPVKTVTTGEGGAVTTNSAEYADRLRRFRHHGIRPTPDAGGWAYDIERVGFNYRLTDIQAALGTSQLGKLERFVKRRNEIAQRYREQLSGTPVETGPPAPSGFRHAYHLFVVLVDERDRAYDAMRAAGIGVQVHYVPTYRFSAYVELGFDRADYPHTEHAYARLLSLPMFPALEDSEQDFVVETLLSIVST